jgi:diacylglycerol kinase (ATP)
VPTDTGRWLAIVNPAAGRRDGGTGWRAVEKALQEAGVAVDTVQTSGVGDATRLAIEALMDGRRRLIAAGGDGSVNEVVQGVMDAATGDAQEVLLAAAPLGTGNDWARSIAMPRDPHGIARAIATESTMRHDIGAIDFPAEPSARRRWFINVAGAGYDADVVAHLPPSVPSALTYLRIALAGLIRYRSPEFRITADGELIDGRLLLTFVANARYCGHRMHVAPVALMDDGLLDVVAVRELSLLRVLPKLAKLYDGRVLGDPVVRHVRARRVRIEAHPPAVVQADGQLLLRTPAEFSVARQAIRVIMGPEGPAAAG